MLNLSRDELNFLLYALGYLLGNVSKDPRDNEMKEWVWTNQKEIYPKLLKEAEKAA